MTINDYDTTMKVLTWYETIPSIGQDIKKVKDYIMQSQVPF